MGAMAARFTEGRKGFEQHAPVLAAEVKRLDQLRDQLLELIDADARAYAGVGAAYGLPRGTPEEKQARQAAIQSALVAAMQPPLAICRAAVTGLAVLDSLRQHVNPNVASDVAVGAYALAAAFRGASVNVLINLKGITDADLRDKVSREGAELAERAAELETGIATAVVTAIEGG